MTDFDRRLLRLRRRTPMSKVFPGIDVSVAPGESTRRFEVAPGWYAQASSVFGREDDPGLAGLLWVRRPEVVVLYLDRATATEMTGQGREFPEPGVEVVGFTPLTFGAVMKHEKAAGRRPMRSASYTVPEGVFQHSDVSTGERVYLFADANPEPNDEVIGILFRASA